MINQVFSNSMIFPCMELFFSDFPGFPWFPELGKKALYILVHVLYKPVQTPFPYLFHMRKKLLNYLNMHAQFGSGATRS